ncbi:transcription-repair coupling factor [Facilibium subflavum]|uniref:transcription-repair coupling factor n=1 Tax=Facilibium subflavum TaxID=2219058 RepID=UPI000E64D6BE|nr:transcription-repair coupling factor [Facilibium subflavum]
MSLLDYSRNIYSNAISSGLGLGLNEYIHTDKAPQLIIAENAQLAQRLWYELGYLLPEKEILFFPDLEILPFDHFSASEDIISTRLNTLYQMAQQKHFIVITSANTLLKYLPPKAFLQANSLLLKKGEHIDLTDKRRLLELAGYQCVNQVLARGEFSIRGSILDIFPMGSDDAFRIDLFDDEVDSIRTFDPETQKSLQTVKAIHILPTQEFIFNKSTLDTFAANWFEHFPHSDTDNPVYQKTMDKTVVGGIEFYLPFFYEQCADIFDYLPENTVIHTVYQTYEAQQRYFNDIKERHDQLSHDRMRPIPSVSTIYLTPDEYAQRQTRFSSIKWLLQQKTKSHKLPFQSIDDIHVHYQYKQPFQRLLDFLDEHTFKKVIFSADSIGRREILFEHLQKLNLHPTFCNTWQQAIDSQQDIIIITSPLIEGVVIAKDTVLITEFDLFANHIVSYKRKTKSSAQAHMGVAVKDLSELKPGAAVVHIEHGVGRYDGLTKLELGSQENEFLTLVYKHEEKLYVPIHSLHLVTRYSGTELEHAPLNQLGSDKWEKQKEKAAQKISDVAAELLNIYAQRSMKKGFGNLFDEKAYLAFSEGFVFEETEDQAQAINDVIKDMIAEKPMDRLICGDVGFGKTEVAMRAAFIAVYNNKQVAVLAPTTLLAQQHFDNFKDRFSEMGANVDVLSRFKSTKQQNEAIEKLSKGQIDIIIGTHKLLSDKVKFNNLGLLIIDEEHRFGVAHKEKMKSFRANIDILTMTATPIPRTLNMAFSAIRDLSVISTPPAKRLSVKTFVKTQNTSVIREAILREILRGGQVYYLHNQVETIHDKLEALQQLFPQCQIAIAHGQMRERQLEKVMFDFQHNRYQVLLCTTIIETGIDIPNANTIIIERADRFGLAQLHQLRGRVGRSHHQAYAYLLTPPFESLQKDAKKRLEAISETASIGGGFMLANHDLEIRGAGELLGKEQSGNMEGIGFNLYMELLQKTVQALQSGQQFNADKLMQSLNSGCELELRIPALFPENYIFDVHTRLGLYKRITSAKDHQDLDEIKIEIIDRFGPIPPYGDHLFQLAHLKLDATSLGIKKIDMHSAGGKVEFHTPLHFDPVILIKVVQMQPGDFKLNQQQQLLIKKPLKEAKQRIDFIAALLTKLMKGHKKCGTSSK